MSQFIESFIESVNPPKKFQMKLHYSSYTHQWMFHIIPTLHIYFESHSPLEHRRLIKDGISGIYISFQWGKWLHTIGVHKKIN
jgi:hypothetical protein